MKIYMEFTVEEFHTLQDLVFNHEGMFSSQLAGDESALALKFGFVGDLVTAEHIRSWAENATPMKDVIFTERMLEELR